MCRYNFTNITKLTIMEILESTTTTSMVKSANLSTCALTFKAKLKMEKRVLAMLDEAHGLLLTYTHREVPNPEAHHYHLEGLAPPPARSRPQSVSDSRSG
ncbi:unnamed protein product [Pipistrellus nathusii]|uniref:Uncharacterized protein n=1 Tax=Pipistrellus nathusii TaxID=59473 RepID=A0ABN9ZXC0_PIPNA